MLTLKYIGAARVDKSFHDADGCLGFDPSDGNLTLFGNPNNFLCAKVKPEAFKAIADKNVLNLPTLPIVGNWFDPSNGQCAALTKTYNSAVTVRGLRYVNGRQYMQWWLFYNVSNKDIPHISIDAGAPSSVPGISSLKCGRYLADAPDGTLYAGSSESKAYGLSNYGPALYGLDGTVYLDSPKLKATDPGWTWQPPAPGTTALELAKWHYQNGQPPDVRPPARSFFNADRIYDVIMPDALPTFLFQRSIGAAFYGPPDVTDGVTCLTDGANRSKGYHHEGQITSFLIFPNIITSKGADRSYYELPLHPYLIRDVGTINGAVDHVGRRIFIEECNGDWVTGGPIIHLWTY